MASAPRKPTRRRWAAGARQRSLLPRASARIATMAADRDQRTTDREAGPKASTRARPVTGLSAKQAGTRARSSRFMEGREERAGSHARPARPAQAADVSHAPAPSLFPRVGNAIFRRHGIIEGLAIGRAG